MDIKVKRDTLYVIPEMGKLEIGTEVPATTLDLYIDPMSGYIKIETDSKETKTPPDLRVRRKKVDGVTTPALRIWIERR